jgi:hypothetical protein
MTDIRRQWKIFMEPADEFDCPDCEYFKTRDTTIPREFQGHLVNEHGYSELEAKRIYHGW